VISQGIIIKDNHVLMVKQYVDRGDIVWNFPGGGIENGESPEEAVIREVHEETGYIIEIIELLNASSSKFSFLGKISSGKLFLDKTLSENEDILEAAWIRLDDGEKFDAYTLPVREMILKRLAVSL
jgi:8-oxo-dGTP diphosphatase